MKQQPIRKLAILAGMALIATMTLSAPAQADITIQYSAVTTGTDAGIAPGGSALNSLVAVQQVGGIFLILTSTATQSSTSGTLNTTTFTMNNTGTGTDTIVVSLAAQGYTQPNPAGTLSSTATGGTSAYTSGQEATLQSYASASNYGLTGLNTVFSGTTTFAQNGFANGNGTGTVNYAFPNSGDALTSFSSNSTYSLGQMLTVTLDVGKSATLTLVTNVQPPSSILPSAPEPATVAMALTALPLLGLGAWARRRRAQA
jgi:hypothetical protein